MVKKLKQEIIIHTNFKNQSIIEQILKKYVLKFKSIESLNQSDQLSFTGIILYYQNYKCEIKPSSLLEKYLIITNSNDLHNLYSKNVLYLSKPTKISQFKNYIDKFLNDNQIRFKDILIVDKKLINLNSNKNCYLTDIEKDIIVYLAKIINVKKNILDKIY